MVLESCRITLTNQQIMISQSVESSLYLLEAEINNGISEVKIDADDGFQVHSYIFDSVEESIESLMNL
ncbi:conserved hypothetical protein [Vibrio chagasii]|uniref:Uncharacterized protein n=1 Tax=Vibrio chagasii TaxID=170679 RepID=A0A7V7NWH8_9VIBR|nr:hypothetical protein [Vibrio chagasii]EDK28822.1 hypothetical protein VSWAT3_21765 [Vibrionales bacterium SWAT-3]PML42540.1 hypothetical protein BCT81_15100 [Vibrio sp. 10N.261.52.A1]KAB0481952.1 hypothetical protein F7Q91_04890 [Vibrio chagasii]CAH6781746.1 conserved hypothetical protein [Vibrio chagasii]CAH6836489.1 conserved hypothetical protein [Vibrio chagasii]